jgi:hypothetical protein
VKRKEPLKLMPLADLKKVLAERHPLHPSSATSA